MNAYTLVLVCLLIQIIVCLADERRESRAASQRRDVERREDHRDQRVGRTAAEDTTMKWRRDVTRDVTRNQDFDRRERVARDERRDREDRRAERDDTDRREERGSRRSNSERRAAQDSESRRLDIVERERRQQGRSGDRNREAGDHSRSERRTEVETRSTARLNSRKIREDINVNERSMRRNVRSVTQEDQVETGGHRENLERQMTRNDEPIDRQNRNEVRRNERETGRREGERADQRIRNIKTRSTTDARNGWRRTYEQQVTIDPKYTNSKEWSGLYTLAVGAAAYGVMHHQGKQMSCF